MQVFIAVSVYMPFDIYGCSRLLIGRTYSDEAGELLGIIEVGKPSGRKDQRRSERNADSFDECQCLSLIHI